MPTRVLHAQDTVDSASEPEICRFLPVAQVVFQRAQEELCREQARKC